MIRCEHCHGKVKEYMISNSRYLLKCKTCSREIIINESLILNKGNYLINFDNEIIIKIGEENG